MKQIKFANDLVSKILDGSKTATWRLFDDKDLQIGDQLEFLNRESREVFAWAEIISVQEKSLGKIAEADFEGHETYSDREKMLETYRGYYGPEVGGGDGGKDCALQTTGEIV